MPFSDRSTVVAECDARTWTEAGLDRMSNAERKAMFERIFAEELEGETLLENKSEWRQFQAVTVDNWHHGNAVLIGDALRVAHFAIGSGTRLAMDDALDLADALREHGDDVPAIQAGYVQRRKPTRDLFTHATVTSFEWYEEMRGHMKAELGDFIYGFLTRTGRINDERMKRYVPDFHEKYIVGRADKRKAG